MISCQEALALVVLSAEERQLIAKIESVVDDNLARAYVGPDAGAPVTFTINHHVTVRVATSVQRMYESRGWRVGIGGVAPLQLQFAPTIVPGVGAPRVEATKLALPPVVKIEGAPLAPKRVLVRMPTRGRPEKALHVLALYRKMAGCQITIEVVVDEDDESMLAAPVRQRLHALGCVLTVGKHKSKVEACNGGRVRDWDILILASDDMVPVKEGYAMRVVEAMEEHWPHLDGALHFNDGHQGENLCTLPVMGRRWYDRWGFVYQPEYESLFCDTEQTHVWRAMNRLTYVNDVIIEHRHPAWGLADKDALYAKNDALWDRDKAVFEKRGLEYVAGGKSSGVLLSICIAALPERRAQRTQLVDELFRQRLGTTMIFRANFLRASAEIVVDEGEGTVGEKRNRLLKRAVGDYVAFVDDDDMVSHDYVGRILGTLLLDRSLHPDEGYVDCTTLRGVMTTAGGTPETFVHELETKWETREGVHYRGINHLNAVRRDLALKAGFPSQDHAEDFEYSKRLAPLLKTQAKVDGDGPLYFYFFNPSKKS